MKRIIFIVAMLLSIKANAVIISDSLVDSICWVESKNNPQAIGDNGKAIGIAQIQPICVHDVNRILKLQGKKIQYTLDDRKSISKSKEMMKVYLSFYGDRYVKKTGKQPTNEVLSRIWNGGPNGWKVKATYAYYVKVTRRLCA